jgi:RHS repeat-associated protein
MLLLWMGFELVRRLRRRVTFLRAPLSAAVRMAALRPVVASLGLLLVPFYLLHAQPAAALTSAQVKGERWYFYLTDHVGSSTVVTDGQGNPVAYRSYKPYGDPVSFQGSPELNQAFEGKPYSAGVGLYDFGPRQYDPTLGRFLSPDSQVPDPKDPRSLLRYAFAADNPIRYVDPSGHSFWSILIVVLIIIAVVVITGLTMGSLTFALVVLAAAVLGGLLGLEVGLATGQTGSDLVDSVLIGAMLGALLAASIVLAVGFAGAATTLAVDAIQGMIQGALISGATETIIDAKSGQSPDQMMNDVLISTGEGAAIGLLSAGVSSGLVREAGAEYDLGASTIKNLNRFRKLVGFASAVANLTLASTEGKSLLDVVRADTAQPLDQGYRDFANGLLAGAITIDGWGSSVDSALNLSPAAP